MQLTDELIEAYLDNSLDHQYYLDLQTGQVILDLDEAITGEPGTMRRTKSVTSIFPKLHLTRRTL